MVTITIRDVISDTLPMFGLGEFRLYVFRDSDFVLYVGKSDQHIIDRIASHLGLSFFGGSQIERIVDDNLPDSNSWCIDLYTLEDCATIVQRHFPDMPGFDVALAEQALILHYSPALNVLMNPHPKPLPPKYTQKKEMRIKNAYNKAFRNGKE